MSLPRETVCAGRMRTALAITVLVMLAVPGADALGKTVDGIRVDGEAPGLANGIDSSIVSRYCDPSESLDALARLLDADDGAPPEAFLAEVGLLSEARNVRVGIEECVVGYVVDEDAESVLAALRADMSARGWTPVELGGIGGCTFVKDDGVYGWALSTCTEVAGSTSVVVRCQCR